MSVRLVRRPLSVAAALPELTQGTLGGVAIFAGRVRPDRTPRGIVRALHFEADEALAERELARLARTARRRYGARHTVVWHRLGTVRVGEIAVIVGAACGHRAEAFAATRFLIEELKTTVPIWKTDRVPRARRPRPRPSPRRGRSAG
jgi:molybdopterin synthase catalytic subunit